MTCWCNRQLKMAKGAKAANFVIMVRYVMVCHPGPSGD